MRDPLFDELFRLSERETVTFSHESLQTAGQIGRYYHGWSSWSRKRAARTFPCNGYDRPQ